MENYQYIPFGSNHVSDDNLIALIERYGMRGYGVYMSLLFELRNRSDFRCARKTLPVLARRWAIPVNLLTSIVDDFKLFGACACEEFAFDTENEPQLDYFYSFYLNKVMEPFEKKYQRTLNVSKSRLVNAEKSAERKTECAPEHTVEHDLEKTAEHPVEHVVEQPVLQIEYNIIEEKKEEITIAEEKKEKKWELLLNEIFEEQSWLEIQAMHSGMQLRFMEQLPAIVDCFKNHIRTYGKESVLLSASDAKNYFSNFIRPGCPTRQRLDALLTRRQREGKARDPYRYEQRDPSTGVRMYCGGVIPPNAPPRPHENAVWSEHLHQWA